MNRQIIIGALVILALLVSLPLIESDQDVKLIQVANAVEQKTQGCNFNAYNMPTIGSIFTQIQNAVSQGNVNQFSVTSMAVNSTDLDIRGLILNATYVSSISTLNGSVSYTFTQTNYYAINQLHIKRTNSTFSALLVNGELLTKIQDSRYTHPLDTSINLGISIRTGCQ